MGNQFSMFQGCANRKKDGTKPKSNDTLETKPPVEARNCAPNLDDHGHHANKGADNCVYIGESGAVLGGVIDPGSDHVREDPDVKEGSPGDDTERKIVDDFMETEKNITKIEDSVESIDNETKSDKCEQNNASLCPDAPGPVSSSKAPADGTQISDNKETTYTEETGHDPAVHGARLEDRFYNNDSFKSPSVDPGSPQQQDAALKIQTNYRKHDAEQKVASMKKEHAAETIQAGVRGHEEREKVKDMKAGKKEEEEEVDIDLNDPEVEAAATKIQAGFKGFKARQEIKDKKDKAQSKAEPAKTSEQEEEVDIDLNDPEVANAAVKIQAGFRGHQSRQQIKQMKEAKKDTKDPEKAEPVKDEVDIDLKDPEVEDAALKIQAGFKGMKARQEIKAKKEEKEKAKAKDEPTKEEIDIDLNDPETEKAALKIQAGFKGMQTRKEIQSKKEAMKAKEKPDASNDENKVDIDLNDQEVEKAATKIQAGFKGYKTRKELKDKSESGDGTSEAQGESKTEGEEETVDIDLNDPEVEKAATKIQAGFKGFKTRQEMSKKKSEVQSKVEGEGEVKTEGDSETKAEGEGESKTEGVED